MKTKWGYRLLVLLGLGISLAAINGCAIGPVVTLEGEGWRGNVEYNASVLNTDPLPCAGERTNVVVKSGGWGGWNDAVINIAGQGLKRHGCIWVESQQSVAFSLIISSFQPGDKMVGMMKLVENATGVVKASISGDLDHGYGRYADSNSRAGGVYTTPRDQVVYNVLNITINPAMENLW